MHERNGIPAELTLEKARAWVEPRMSEFRFKHTQGVAAVARELAEKAGADVFVAELGGWLHDACKEHNDKQLVAEAKEFGMVLHPVEESNGHILHGPVAALTARRDLNVTNEVLLNAIAEHTLGAIDMTPLSQILFLADCLEESRPNDFTVPIWHALGYQTPEFNPQKRKFSGKLDLDAAVLIGCDLSLRFLLEDKKLIHPKTVDVRNWYLNKIKLRVSV